MNTSKQVIWSLLFILSTQALLPADTMSKAVPETTTLVKNLKGIGNNLWGLGEKSAAIFKDIVSFGSTLTHNVTGLMNRFPRTCIGIGAYTLWYNYQKYNTKRAIKDAKQYLGSLSSNPMISLHPVGRKLKDWRLNDYPTPRTIQVAAHENVQVNHPGGVVSNQNRIATVLAHDYHQFKGYFCQCQNIDCSKALKSAIEKEHATIGDILNRLKKSRLTWVPFLWNSAKTDGIMRDVITHMTQLNEQEDEALQAYMKQNIAYLGLPGGAWYNFPCKWTKWFTASFDGVGIAKCMAPVRWARALIWPYEGQASKLYWELFKRQQRLEAMYYAIANTLIIPAREVIFGQPRDGCCGSPYCVNA